jgi:lysylphosphatidylglycerol synthetase-like protein (DUF2156 family)
MKIGGHRMREHLRLLGFPFALIFVVWLLRLVLSLTGVPNSIVRFASVTAATALAIVVAIVLMHWRNFGGYASVVVASFLLNVWSEVLIVLAVAFSVLSRIENIYTAPEYSVPGEDALHLVHMRAHLTFGIGIGTLEGAAMGSLVLWLLRTLLPSPRETGRDRSLSETATRR